MPNKKINLICPRRIDKYKKISNEALNVAKKNIAKGKEKQAKEIIKMVSCYLQDADYFQKKGDFVNSFAAINYAHGWLDCGARLKIFLVKDRKLFTI